MTTREKFILGGGDRIIGEKNERREVDGEKEARVLMSITKDVGIYRFLVGTLELWWIVRV